MKKHLLYILLFSGMVCSAQPQDKKAAAPRLFTESLNQEGCTFVSKGGNECFILEPGYQCTYRGIESTKAVQLVITVLDETKMIGGVETRVVEENESVNGKTVEISRNYFALCKETGNVFYFGEEVDIYHDGIVISHDGAWIAEGNNKAGIMMPGSILLGARYYQEIAPDVAMDRAEIISDNEELETPAGKFTGCIKIEETTPLEPGNKGYKIYGPGVGLIKDGVLELTKFGFLK